MGPWTAFDQIATSLSVIAGVLFAWFVVWCWRGR